jgi:hypothetical protein
MKLEAEKCRPYLLDGADGWTRGGGDGGGGGCAGGGSIGCGAREDASFQGRPPRRRRRLGGAASEGVGGGDDVGEERRHATRRRRRRWRGPVLDAVAVGGGRDFGDAFRIFFWVCPVLLVFLFIAAWVLFTGLFCLLLAVRALRTVDGLCVGSIIHCLVPFLILYIECCINLRVGLILPSVRLGLHLPLPFEFTVVFLLPVSLSSSLFDKSLFFDLARHSPFAHD